MIDSLIVHANIIAIAGTIYFIIFINNEIIKNKSLKFHALLYTTTSIIFMSACFYYIYGHINNHIEGNFYDRKFHYEYIITDVLFAIFFIYMSESNLLPLEFLEISASNKNSFTMLHIFLPFVNSVFFMAAYTVIFYLSFFPLGIEYAISQALNTNILTIHSAICFFLFLISLGWYWPKKNSL